MFIKEAERCGEDEVPNEDDHTGRDRQVGVHGLL